MQINRKSGDSDKVPEIHDIHNFPADIVITDIDLQQRIDFFKSLKKGIAMNKKVLCSF